MTCGWDMLADPTQILELGIKCSVLHRLWRQCRPVKQLGSGAYGSVHLCEDTIKGTQVELHELCMRICVHVGNDYNASKQLLKVQLLLFNPPPPRHGGPGGKIEYGLSAGWGQHGRVPCKLT